MENEYFKKVNSLSFSSGFYRRLKKIKRLDNCIKLKSKINKAKNPDVSAS